MLRTDQTNQAGVSPEYRVVQVRKAVVVTAAGGYDRPNPIILSEYGYPNDVELAHRRASEAIWLWALLRGNANPTLRSILAL